MSIPRVSVALCTHNGARFLDAQLHSLAAQSQLPHELVIGDDASTDGTIEQLERFAKEVPFPVRITKNPEPVGVTENFSRTLAACSGDVLMPCDQDDVWHPEKIASQAA